MFKKILIANRGEIAVRVIRACHEMGIAAVAVYSDVDRASLHVRKADEAYPIGAPAASESYLNIQKILDVAARSGRRRHPSRLRISFREREVRPSLRRRGRKVHRPHRRGDGRHGIENPRPAGHGARGRSVRARHFTRPRIVRAGRAGCRAHRLSRDAESGRGRRRQRHASGARTARIESRRSRQRAARRSDRLATAKSISRKRSSTRATSRCRCWPTSMATPSISASASVRCSAAIRRWSRKRLHRSSIPTCGAAWAKSRFAWPRLLDTRTPAPLSFWSTSRRISISSR